MELFAKIGKTIKAGVKNVECISQPDGVPLSKSDLEVLQQYDSKWPIQESKTKEGVKQDN